MLVLLKSIYEEPWLWTRNSNLRRWCLLILSAIECTLLSGIMYGASSLFLIMRTDGQYSKLCNKEDDRTYLESTKGVITCASANLKYSQIYTAAALTTPIAIGCWGLSIDYFGVLRNRVFSLFMIAGGCVLFAESDSEKFDAFVAASVLIAFGGAGFSLTHYTYCMHWEDTKFFEISHSIMNTAYDASTLTFTIFHLFNTANGAIFSLRLLFYTLAVTAIFFAFMSHKWVWGKYLEPPEKLASVNGKRVLSSIASIKNLGFNSSDYFDNKISIQNDGTEIRLRDMTFFEQLRTTEYVMLALWSFTIIYRTMFFFGSIFEQLVYNENGRGISDANSLVIICNGLILTSIPLFWHIGLFMKKYGLAVSITVVNVLGIVAYVLLMLNNSYWSLCIGFIAFGLFRSTCYTTITIYCQKLFGPETFGKMYGIGVGFWAIASAVLQYPTMQFVLDSPRKSIFIVDLVIIGGSVLMFIFPAWLYLKERKLSESNPARGESRNSEVSFKNRLKNYVATESSS